MQYLYLAINVAVPIQNEKWMDRKQPAPRNIFGPIK